jgi:hypothetical protein
MTNEEISTTLKQRIEALQKEGNEAAQRAAAMAFEPYRVAIEENKRTLALLETNPPPSD